MKEIIVYEITENEGAKVIGGIFDPTISTAEDVRNIIGPSGEKLYANKNIRINLTQAEIHELYLKTLKPITRRQFRLALFDEDLLSTVEHSIDNIGDSALRERVQIEYRDADYIDRTSPTVALMASFIGFDDEQVNLLWEKALKY